MKIKKTIFSVMVFFSVFAPIIALALPVGTATLTWDPPITNTDGTSLTDLSGYKLYYGTASGVYGVTVDIPCGILPCPGFATNPPTDLERQQKISSHPTIIAISGLEDNRSWYFAATALDTSANESGYSNEVSRFIPSSTTDTDGDGMTDVWETANGLNPNSAADAAQDADGDGLTNVFEYRAGLNPKELDFKIHFSGDWTGDGKDDVVTYNMTSGKWNIQDSATGTVKTVHYGAPGLIPAPFDYNNDKIIDPAVYDPNSGWFWGINRTVSSNVYGCSGCYKDIPPLSTFAIGDVPTVGRDWTGDGKDDVVTYNMTSGKWNIQDSATGTVKTVHYGAPGLIPAPFDYNNDKIIDPAVYDPNSGWFWGINRTVSSNVYGCSGCYKDIPPLSTFAIGDVPM